MLTSRKKEEQAKERLLVLLEKARQMEESGSFTGDVLSSTELRQQFEAETPGLLTYSQGVRPGWLRNFQNTLQSLDSDNERERERI